MTSGLVPLGAPIADEHLGTWASTFLQIASVSAQLARTPFVPASLRVTDRGTYDEGATAANVAAAILTGQELGMEPMSALRSINVINATPALSALALRALLQRYGHQIWLVEATNTRAVVAGLRAGEPETHTQRITWTMDDARARNLAGRPNWRSQPRNMLIARATSEVARLIAADAVLGIPYTIEELEDGDQASGSATSDEESTEPAPRTARRRRGKATAAAAPTSAQDGAGAAQSLALGTGVAEPAGQTPEDEPPLDEPVEAITDTQRRGLQSGFRNLGIDRAERLATVTRVVERPVTSANDLTKDEAAKVLDEIALMKARAATPPPTRPEDEPPLDDEEPPASAPATTEDFAAISVLFDVAQFAGGREGQDARMRYASNIVGREVAGPTDLTHGEAAEVVAALRLMAEDMPSPDDPMAPIVRRLEAEQYGSPEPLPPTDVA
jgi:hypothetical protein